jgi:hypothetical protein
MRQPQCLIEVVKKKQKSAKIRNWTAFARKRAQERQKSYASHQIFEN